MIRTPVMLVGHDKGIRFIVEVRTTFKSEINERDSIHQSNNFIVNMIKNAATFIQAGELSQNLYL